MPSTHVEVTRDPLLDGIHDRSDSEDDQPMGSPDRHQNADPFDGANGNEENNGETAAATDEVPAPPHSNAAARASQTGGNARQTVNQMIAFRKLDDNAQQDLHRYAQASALEQNIMQYTLGLEVRQETQRIANAIVSTGIHPDLATNLKIYTAAVFFSPNLTYYRPSRTGSQLNALQKLVLKTLRANRVAHLPVESDKASAEKLISAIGTHFTDYRSGTKSLLENRKVGESDMDLGSLVARAVKNTDLKITAKHYGRFAFLSRQWELWTAGNRKKNFWQYVDAALVATRQEAAGSQPATDKYFKAVIREDEKKWGKPVGALCEYQDLEEWQRVAQSEAGNLVG